MIKKSVAVIIPVYKESADEFELCSLNRCFSLWGSRFDIYFVKPSNLDIGNLCNRFESGKIAEFDDEYFTDLAAYNRLMFSAGFYERFLDYKYIFIYQTDGYAFRDELEDWCSKDYDYIGAPWIPKDSYGRFYNRAFVHIRRYINNLLDRPDRSLQYYEVGNGGVSLRKTEVFHSIARSDSTNIERYISNLGKSSMYNEDIYWSLAPKPVESLSSEHRSAIHSEANRSATVHSATNRSSASNNMLSGNSFQLTKPDYREALRFSFDMNPLVCYHLNNNQLPFCCHSFSKPKFWKFWKNHISI